MPNQRDLQNSKQTSNSPSCITVKNLQTHNTEKILKATREKCHIQRQDNWNTTVFDRNLQSQMDLERCIPNSKRLQLSNRLLKQQKLLKLKEK